MSTTIWGNRRTKQLVTAARAGHLVYDSDGTLLHRSLGLADIEASRRDAEVVAALVDLGLLCRDEFGVVTAAGGS